MEALKPSELLAKAADLIEPEGRWTQGEQARDEFGEEVPVFWYAATCFCLEGACKRVMDEAGFDDADEGYDGLIPIINKVIGDANPFRWNDAPERTQAEVVAALRKAAELARSEGQ